MRHVTQKLRVLLISLLLIFSVSTLLPVSSHIVGTASAASVTCYDGSTAASENACTHACPNPDGTTGKRVPQDQDCALSNGNCSTSVTSCDLVQKFVVPFIDFLSALVGVAVVFSIIVGGIQYSSSADDPAKVSAAKNRIRNAIIALLVYFFLFAMLSFLIPGGLSIY